MKCTPRLRNSLGANTRRKKSKFSICTTTFLTSRPGNRLTYSPRRGEQWAGRACGTVLPPCPHSSQAVMHSGPRAFLLCPCLTQKGNKEQRWLHQPHCPSVPALQPGQLTGNILGIGIKLLTSTGRPAKAQDSFPLPWQQGSSLKSLLVASEGASEISELLVASGEAGITSTRPQRMGKTHPLPKCRWDAPSRKWEQPVLAISNHSAGSARWSAVHPMLPTQLA